MSRRTRGTRERYRAARLALAHFGRPHAGWFWLGITGSIGVVACRLAIPWPLRWALEAAQGEASLFAPIAALDAPVLAIALSYLAIALFLGGSEHLQRLNLGRFTAHLGDDLRAAAVRGATRGHRRDSHGIGDLTTRIIGDSTRLKSDLSGIAIHASANGLLFVAVTAIMFAVSVFFGVIFLVSGLLAVAIGAATARKVEPNARKQRKKEGQYAEALHAEIERGDWLEEAAEVSGAGGQKELRATQLMTRGSWLVHGVLGASVGIGLWFGVQEVQAGAMAPGELFLFVAYALTVHRRMVQVGRQTARTGKLVASTNRLASLAATEPLEAPSETVALSKGVCLVEVELLSERLQPGLAPTSLTIEPGSRVAVLGPTGAGKSRFLRLLSGREPRVKGAILWDDLPVDVKSGALRARVGFVGETATFGRRPLWEHVGLESASAPDPDQKETLRRIGAWPVLRSVSRELTTRMSSLQVSAREARALALGRLLLNDPSPIWILDGVLEGLPKKKARQCLDEILERAGDRSVVMSMGRVLDLERFDRVLTLRRGRIVFDGSPADWKQRGQAA